jgi:hypothetical protein
MRNVWKGLVVGGLTGATAGVVLDSLARASRKATQIGLGLRGSTQHLPRSGWIERLGGVVWIESQRKKR